MKINITLDEKQFNGVPFFREDYILQTAVIPKIRFNTKYYYYNSNCHALKAIKFIALALIVSRGYEILTQECDKTEWKPGSFIKNNRFFDSKESFFKNLKNKDNESCVHFESVSLATLFAEYRYAAVLRLEKDLWIWNGNAVNPQSAKLKHFVITDKGAFACFNNTDINGNEIFINRADCIANGLDGLEIQDFSNKENNNMFSISDIKEIEKTKIKVIEIA